MTDDSDKVPLALRRKEGTNALEACDGEILYTTSIDGDRYLSIPMNDDETGETSWNIYGYEPLPNGELKVYGLNPDVVSKAIVKGELAGSIVGRRVWGRFFSRVDQEMEITDAPEYLRRFLKRHGRKCWDEQYAATFVRQ